MASTEDLVKRLARFGVEIKVYQFDTSTHTVEDAARALQVVAGQIAKSLLIMLGERPALFVLAGDKKLDQARIKRQFGVRKVKFAGPDTVLRVSGYPVGGVPPLPLHEDVPVYLDRSLFRFDVVYPAAGQANNCFGIKVDTLCRVTGGTVTDCVKEETSSV